MTVDLWDGALIDASVWHGRAGATSRQFRYRTTYAALPVGALEAGNLALRPDRHGLWRLRRRDYGWRDGRSLSEFIDAQLAPAGLDHCKTTLVTMPRGLLHGFNPVSFWLARDVGGLRAVLAEVSNTFGECHLYLVRHQDNRVIAPPDRLSGDKLFHVSPFLPRSGRYVFRFDTGPGRFGAWIDWLAADGSTVLRTSMTGHARALTTASLRGAAIRSPLQPARVSSLIHWQAAKLFSRGVRYRTKPEQIRQRRSEVTRTEDENV
ncbi:DUF1365 domain-containing protein [Paracoccus sp. SCSIO 75233]|uniref:DUF1365 domain-containing protein n=1 Tax=Paracoccus sp. SCSIO 75233 TaxID=3017782 RepID=UPI0022F0746E|nr:DUF1365 domain-containing protein [Paracoccus sp. SCSIO 75233]WBU53966.1 DUF1365 domain-containing protein [Paracoccus sp. SCSIO 75233]